MIEKANRRNGRNNTICSSIAFEGTRGNCRLNTEKAIEITRPIVEKERII